MNKKYHLHLKGYVGSWDFDADYVDYILNKNQDKEVEVLIDSLGGSLSTALSIAAAFKNHGNVRVHFVGMNASAATIASLGAKHISIDSSAMYLVHKCSSSFFEWGSMNSDQLQEKIEEYRKMKDNLDKFDGNVASMYARKCKKETTALLDLMKVGGWLTAKEAHEWGFVDEITDAEEDKDNKPMLNNKLVASMDEAGIPIPTNIKNEDKGFVEQLKRLLGFGGGSAGTGSAAGRESGNASANSSTALPHGNNPEGKDNNINSNIDNTMKNLQFICALLALEALAFEDGKAMMTETQMKKIEDTLSENNKLIDELKATIATAEKTIAEKDAAIAAKVTELETKTTEAADKDNVIAEKEKTIADKDKEISDKAAEIKDLTAQVEALQKNPGDDSQQVVDGKGREEANVLEDFCANAKAARELFDRV